MAERFPLHPFLAVPADQRPMGVVFAWVDGACSNNPGKGGWAFRLETVLAKNGDVLIRERWGMVRETTNNRMELQAAIEALRAIRTRNNHVLVVSDSKYLVDGATKWMLSWKEKHWRTKEGGGVANQDLWHELDTQMGWQQVQFWWIPGHSGDENNEKVDGLAQASAQ